MRPDPSNVAIIIPTLNAGPLAGEMVRALARQGFPPSAYLIIDSGSKDGTVETFERFGAHVIGLDGRRFNHGGTRAQAIDKRPDAAFYVFLTHDAIPASDDAISRLLAAFEDETVGMAYGRQLPRSQASAIERHARLRNYTNVVERRSIEMRAKLGIRTVFCSNSFSAYRASAYREVGGFPRDSYFGEDQVLAGKLLLAGQKLIYQADAEVIHSHDYSVREDFARYFDVGVFHNRNGWLGDTFGNAEGEGIRFVKSELSYLAKHDPVAMPSAVVRTFAKYVGYRLGRMEGHLPLKVKRLLAMQKFYWR